MEDFLIIIILIAIVAIPGLIMMNIGVWQFKKAGSAFSDIKKMRNQQKSDNTAFRIQEIFYRVNPGKSQEIFILWYTQKVDTWTRDGGAYPSEEFNAWLSHLDVAEYKYVDPVKRLEHLKAAVKRLFKNQSQSFTDEFGTDFEEFIEFVREFLIELKEQEIEYMLSSDVSWEIPDVTELEVWEQAYEFVTNKEIGDA